MMQPIRLGISTCPNDTYAFHALMEGLVDWRGLDFHVELLDIQQLNDRLLAEQFDVAKASFSAAITVAEKYWVLPSGSALGFGVGPLLLSSKANIQPEENSQLTLCPGEHTTAALLFRMFYPESTRIEQVVFSDIMPRLIDGTADFGVCIHEGRFTWQDHGLGLVEDLGARWEQETHCPLPLGGILASRSLGESVVEKVQAVVRDSLLWANAHPVKPLASMRKYAQEFNDDVLMQHVELYVNDWTIGLGEVGQQALDELAKRAHRVDTMSLSRLEVFPSQ